MTKKYCSGCKAYHDIEEFGLKPSSHDGHKSRCVKWTKEKTSIIKEVPPEGSVEKVCPSCGKHIFVIPTEETGICSKCGIEYNLSPSWTAKNGVDIWIPKGKRNNLVSPKVISFLQENKCIEKKVLPGFIDAHRVKVFNALSTLKDKGLVKEKWENHVCYVELVA